MWRPMTPADLPRVGEIAAALHPSYPESPAVFAERLALYPEGCHVLAPAGGALAGYVVSHPWLYQEPPALNTLIGALPAQPSTYYIHDIALLSEARGSKAAQDIVTALIDHARRVGFSNLSLVAVNDSQGFWQRLGFARVDGGVRLAARLKSYDNEACFMALDRLGK